MKAAGISSVDVARVLLVACAADAEDAGALPHSPVGFEEDLGGEGDRTFSLSDLMRREIERQREEYAALNPSPTSSHAASAAATPRDGGSISNASPAAAPEVAKELSTNRLSARMAQQAPQIMVDKEDRSGKAEIGYVFRRPDRPYRVLTVITVST